MSLHSEAAALLLVWAANLIKLYACTKKLGDFEALAQIQTMQALSPTADEMTRISARTKLKVKQDN